jgi:hypothetical protein
MRPIVTDMVASTACSALTFDEGHEEFVARWLS